jgi:hypothetical protein
VLRVEEVLRPAFPEQLEASMISTFFFRAAGFFRRRMTMQPASCVP